MKANDHAAERPEGAATNLVFDVSTLVQRSHLRPTGIERVILEVAVSMMASAPARDVNVRFCRFDASGRRYVEVDASLVSQVVAGMRGDVSDASLAPTFTVRGRARVTIGKVINRSTRRLPTARRHLRRSAGHAGRVSVEVLSAVKAAATSLRGLVSRSPLPDQAGQCRLPIGWSTGTTYCSLGMDWLHNDLQHLARWKAACGFRTVLMVHDLLPLVTPQYSAVAMDQYFPSLLTVADVVVVNSDATLDDLVRFAGERRLAIPTVVKLPMPSALRDLTTVRPTTLPADVTDGGFVLCVGTITIRKNHQLLFDVWEQLLASRDRGDLPDLVVVGARGWLSEETMSRLTRTPAFKGIVHHLDHATDENVAWLYEHCAFTVYPSLYEGWGLPVSESHDFGKVCLTTNRSSLPEAGEGLAELLDPHDRTLWRETIFRYWTDRTYRDAREADIRQQHRRITAHDSANTILNTITMNNPELSSTQTT